MTAPGMVLAVAVAAASASGGAAAQEHGGEIDRRAGPRALVHRPGARTAALGGSFWVGERNDAAVFHHPALLGGTGFGAAYAHLADGSALMSAAASGAWFGGTAGIGLAFADGVSNRGREVPEGGPEHVRAGSRDARRSGGRDDGFGHAEEGASFAMSAGFAADVLGVRAGGVAKIVGRSGPGERRATVALDLGAAMDAGPLALALSVQNLGPGMETDGQTVPLPTRVALGAGTDREPVGPFDIGAAAHLAVERGAGTRGGAGVEVAWWPVSGRVFVARGGLAGGGYGLASTFGAGFEGDRIRLDYGYGPRDGGASRHAVSLAFR